MRCEISTIISPLLPSCRSSPFTHNAVVGCTDRVSHPYYYLHSFYLVELALTIQSTSCINDVFVNASRSAITTGTGSEMKTAVSQRWRSWGTSVNPPRASEVALATSCHPICLSFQEPAPSPRDREHVTYIGLLRRDNSNVSVSEAEILIKGFDLATLFVDQSTTCSSSFRRMARRL